MKTILLALMLSLSFVTYASNLASNTHIENDVIIGTPKSKPKTYNDYHSLTLEQLPKQQVKEPYSIYPSSRSDYVPNDTYYNEQVHWLAPTTQYLSYNNILPSVQRLSPMRRPVVGIIDSGFYAHPDLIYADGYDMVTLGDAQRGENYLMRESDDEEHFCNVHGTGVAAVAVATRDNNLGFAGIADGDFLATRSMDCGFGYLSDSSDALLWQIGKPVEDIRPATVTADVVNMSLGGTVDHCPDFMQNAITEAVNSGVPVIAAIGNNEMDASEFTPANCNGVINVAAASREGELFSSSNFGTLIDIAALGDFVASATEDPDGVGWWEESSFSAPIVTGVLANAVSEFGLLSNAEIKFFLAVTATPFAAGQCDDSNRCGPGIMDANAFHSSLREYKNGDLVTLKPALSNTEFCDKDLYATDDNELAMLCETYELVMPVHQSNRSDIRFEVMVFVKDDTMQYANGQVVATSTSSRMLMSALDMSSNDYGVRMCNTERCFGDTAIKINSSSTALPAKCNQ
ncbi:S8 family serine peptidase [uncultured Paraglaciecola sp.]|uniref:S8 family peptidase n=1 Tax=uncultured Paraglaciecola sp. TaxID=1765024 RepID=UPI0030D7D7B0